MREGNTKLIAIAGYGNGISAFVARRFGSEGFAIALISRTQEKLDAAAKCLEAEGIRAAGFAADLADPVAVNDALARITQALGPITVLHWNPFNSIMKPLMQMTSADLDVLMGTTVKGLLAAVQAVLPQLEGQTDAAVLVTGGGLSLDTEEAAAAAVSWDAGGIGLAKAAQRKLVALLHSELQPRGVFVGEVTVVGVVKASKWETEGQREGVIDAADVAGDLWYLYRSRDRRWLLRDRDSPASQGRPAAAAHDAGAPSPAMAGVQ